MIENSPINKMNAAKQLAVCLFFSVLSPSVFGQGTAFTYQGRLNDNGLPANGSYDFTFQLFTTNNGGTGLAGSVTNAAIGVSNGLFTTTVDLGEVFTGASNWPEIADAPTAQGPSAH